MMRQDGLEFLSSSLKRRLTGKPVVAWRNIGCFLMLPFQQFFFLHGVTLCASMLRSENSNFTKESCFISRD